MAAPAAVLAAVRAARPRFRNRADALVFALHAALLAEGFVLVAAGDAAEEEPPRGGALLPETGHEGWNAAEEEYAFRYRREGAAAAHGTVVLKALAAGAKLFVDAAAPSPGATAHLELRRAGGRCAAAASACGARARG
jgi:proteasome inhibitor subunit 1 (PI31)